MSRAPGSWQKRRGWLSISVLAACASFLALFPTLLPAQQDERSVRTAFVYNVTKYVAWPTSTHDLNICVLGAGNIGPALKSVLDGKTSEQRTMHVVLEPSEAEIHRCGIIYWSGAAGPRMRSILDKTHATSILTIGESDSFVREGGMIGFVRSGDSIQIEVNLDSVQAGGLKVSSRFLDLALIVHSGKRG